MATSDKRNESLGLLLSGEQRSSVNPKLGVVSVDRMSNRH